MSDGFPRFAELPTEIRLKIWQLWMSPRLVSFPQLPMKERLSYWALDNARRDIKPPGPDSSIPLALLGVNKESNFAMSKFYSRRFGFTKQPGSNTLSGTEKDIQGVIFNSDIDVLFVRKEGAEDLANYCPDGLNNLRYVAVFAGCNSDWGLFITSSFPALGRLFGKCGHLERLYLCILDPFGRDIDEEDELRRKSFEDGLLEYGDRYTSDRKHSGRMSSEDAQKRWRDVMKVTYISQMRKERGMEGYQVAQSGIAW